MKISINSHSSIRAEGTRVLWFDPFQMSAAPHDADILFVTHDHFDHYAPEDLEKAAKPDTHFVVSADLAEKFPPERTTALRVGETTEIQGVAVTAIASYNMDKDFHPKKNGWLGYLVTMDGESLYVCGDTDATPEAKAVKCDILALPVGGTFTMDAVQAAELARAVMPKLAIPTHYGTSVGRKADAEKFRELVKDAMEVKLLVEDAK